MTGEIYRRWEVAERLPARVVVLGIWDKDDGLCVELAGKGDPRSRFVLCFEDFVAYRNVNESFRNRLWNSKAIVADSLLMVENSRWLKWLNEESGGVVGEFDVSHYAIYTDDDCIDVLSRVPPQVSFVRDEADKAPSGEGTVDG